MFPAVMPTPAQLAVILTPSLDANTYTSDARLFAKIKADFPDVSARLVTEWSEYQITTERKPNGQPDYDAECTNFIGKTDYDRDAQACDRHEVYCTARDMQARFNMIAQQTEALFIVTCRTMDGTQYAHSVDDHFGLMGITESRADASIYTATQAQEAADALNQWRENAKTGEAWDSAPHNVQIIPAVRERSA